MHFKNVVTYTSHQSKFDSECPVRRCNSNLDLLHTKCRIIFCHIMPMRPYYAILTLNSNVYTGSATARSVPTENFLRPTPPPPPTEERETKHRASYARWPLAARAVNTTTHYLITSDTTEKTNIYGT